MNLYTHAILANQLISLVNPTHPAEYIWGAVVPDIRYLAGMRRQMTHLPDEEIKGWLSRYPGCESFIQGYRVHCLLDSIDTTQVLSKVFPLNLQQRLRRKPLSAQQSAVVIELYYQKRFPQGLTLLGAHNPILEDLGIQADQTGTYCTTLASYLACPSFETAITYFTKLGFLEDTRVEKYLSAYRRMVANPIFLWILMASVKNAHFENLAATQFRSLAMK